jgi:hypothetical protein
MPITRSRESLNKHVLFVVFFDTLIAVWGTEEERTDGGDFSGESLHTTHHILTLVPRRLPDRVLLSTPSTRPSWTQTTFSRLTNTNSAMPSQIIAIPTPHHSLLTTLNIGRILTRPSPPTTRDTSLPNATLKQIPPFLTSVRGARCHHPISAPRLEWAFSTSVPCIRRSVQ